ncbi:MAG TPA: CopD family protein [Gemmatimonadaceae bacterium]|nr:CopD family protein [Gemmatimonadaceae bacterium]
MIHHFYFALHTLTGPLDWADAARDWTGFLGIFAMVGAIGFRVLVLARLTPQIRSGPELESREAVLNRATANAALVGAIGVLIFAVTFLASLADADADAGGEPGGMSPIVSGVVFLVTLIGFILSRLTARRDGTAGWYLAALGVLCIVFGDSVMPLSHGHWPAIINPLHVFGGSLWLGTLFVLVVAGLPAVLHQSTSHEHRGPLTADLVNAFSPVALCSATLLVLTGVITAWRHLKYLSALWTTSYGQALIVKLCLVAIVLALGAWNWRRMRPTLGDESAAHAIRRSASAELAFATAVLIVTAILVNLPTPKVPVP